MVYFEVPSYAAEVGAEVELLREILHAVVKVCSQHHLELLRVDLTVLVHHEIGRAGCLEIEAVVRAVGIAQAEEMTEFVCAFLLEGMTVGVLADRCDAGVFSGPVQSECFELEGLKEAPSPAPERRGHIAGAVLGVRKLHLCESLAGIVVYRLRGLIPDEFQCHTGRGRIRLHLLIGGVVVLRKNTVARMGTGHLVAVVLEPRHRVFAGPVSADAGFSDIGIGDIGAGVVTEHLGRVADEYTDTHTVPVQDQLDRHLLRVRVRDRVPSVEGAGYDVALGVWIIYVFHDL